MRARALHQRRQRRHPAQEVGRDPARCAKPADALQFPSRHREGEIGARQAQRRGDARLGRDEPRHHQEQRIAAPFVLGEFSVEFGIGADLRRIERRIRPPQQRGEKFAAETEVFQRPEFDRLARIEQVGSRQRHVAVAADQFRQPADLRLRLPLQQQQPQFRPPVEVRIDEFVQPILQRLAATRGVVEHDQRRLVPTPSLRTPRRPKILEIARADETCIPCRTNFAREFRRQPRLAAPRAADQHAQRNRLLRGEPALQIRHFARASKQRNDVAAVGAEPGRLGPAARHLRRALGVERQRQLALRRADRDCAVAIRLDDDVIVARDNGLHRPLRGALPPCARLSPGKSLAVNGRAANAFARRAMYRKYLNNCTI